MTKTAETARKHIKHAYAECWCGKMHNVGDGPTPGYEYEPYASEMTIKPDLNRKPSPTDLLPAPELRDVAAELLAALEMMLTDNENRAMHGTEVNWAAIHYGRAVAQKAKGL